MYISSRSHNCLPPVPIPRTQTCMSTANAVIGAALVRRIATCSYVPFIDKVALEGSSVRTVVKLSKAIFCTVSLEEEPSPAT